jgi:CAP-Gly domain-containing linker protein 1
LEQEVERLKEKLARNSKKLSKTSTESGETRSRASLESTTSTDTCNGRATDVCEICEQPGHDIFNCDLLKGSAPPTNETDWKKGSGPLDLFCEDCDSPGHLATDCPHSMDIF